MGACTLPPCRLHSCGINDDLTLSGAGDYHFDQCYSDVAGTATPSVDFGGAVGSTNLNMRHYSGGIEIENMGGAGTDVMSLEGFGQLVINANCSGGTVSIRGTFTVTDNAAGAVALTDDARFTRSETSDAVWDEAKAGHVGGGSFGEEVQSHALESVCTEARLAELDAANLPADIDTIDTKVSALNDLSAAQVNAEVVGVVRTDTVAEIAAVPASNAPLHTMLQWLFTLVRNKRITTEHLDTLRNDADGADIATAALTHTATDFTKDEYS